MIAYIEGRVVECTETSAVVVTVSGVGYEVFLPSHTLATCRSKGNLIHFYISTVVREDAFELFGFELWDERDTFIVLRSINRVGARTALSILSSFRPEDLRKIVQDEDVHALTQVPGIGKKSAQQIFLELKYKMTEGPVATSGISPARSSGPLADAVAGLLNLGYEEKEATHAVKISHEGKPDADVGDLLRMALKHLSKG